MPFTNRPYAKQLSDIVVNELDPKVGYARETINVTPPGGGAALAAGTVVYRAKATPTSNNTETATFTFKDVTASGENATITIAGRVITITDGSSATAAQIAEAFITGETVGSAAVSGSLSGYTVAAGATSAEAVFASTTPNTNVTDLTAAVTGDAGALTPVISQGAAYNQTYAALSAAAQVSIDNEFAVVFGDHYGFKESFVPSAVDSSNPIAGNAVAFVRGPVQLKDYYLRQITQDSGGAALSDSEFNQLCELLSKQGIIVEKTLTEQ